MSSPRDWGTLLTKWTYAFRLRRRILATPDATGDQFTKKSSRLPLIRSRTKTALGDVPSPKGRVLRRHTAVGIPAPPVSRRETPINRAGDYPTCRNGVKAILARLWGDAERRGGDRGAWGTVAGIGLTGSFCAATFQHHSFSLVFWLSCDTLSRKR